MTQKEIEFMGYLKAEGCFRMNKALKRAKRLGWKTTPLYTCHIIIAQRGDSAEIIRWAQNNYGGTITYYKGRKMNDGDKVYQQKPYYVWSLHSAKTIIPLLKQFIKSELPSNKLEQAELLLKVCELKQSKFVNGRKSIRGEKMVGYRWYSDEEIKLQEDTYNKLKEIKKYKV